MIIDGKEIFIAKQAYNGNIDAICEMTNINALKENWDRSTEFLEMLVEHEPKLCEQKLLEISGYQVPYEMMLGIIGGVYYGQGNFPLCYKWYQKYIDYMDYKNAKYPYAAWHRNKYDDELYIYMKDCNQLGKTENRFMLKWEQQIFYNK